MPAFRPQFGRRSQERCVIERTGLEAQRSFQGSQLVVYPDATLRAEGTSYRAAAISCARKRFETSAEELERLLTDRETHTEGTARLPLALGAMTDDDGDRLALDSIPHSATLAATFTGSDHGLDPPEWHAKRYGSMGKGV